jgi:hypothetical protein
VFGASRPFLLFDYFRVPYGLDEEAAPPPRLGRLRASDDDGERLLLWPRMDELERAGIEVAGELDARERCLQRLHRRSFRSVRAENVEDRVADAQRWIERAARILRNV